MIGDFYTSGMDSAAIEAKGYQPIKADLDRINDFKNMYRQCSKANGHFAYTWDIVVALYG